MPAGSVAIGLYSMLSVFSVFSVVNLFLPSSAFSVSSAVQCLPLTMAPG